MLLRISFFLSLLFGLACTLPAAAADATPPTHRFLATGDAKAFEGLARRFLGPEVGSVQHQDL